MSSQLDTPASLPQGRIAIGWETPWTPEPICTSHSICIPARNRTPVVQVVTVNMTRAPQAVMNSNYSACSGFLRCQLLAQLRKNSLPCAPRMKTVRKRNMYKSLNNRVCCLTFWRLNVFYIQYKNSVRTSRQTHYVSATNINL
jgi:hypothetical protein